MSKSTKVSLLYIAVLLITFSCKKDELSIVNLADTVSGTYDCSTTIGELNFKNNAEIQITSNNKKSTGQVDVVIVFLSTNNKIDFTEVAVKKGGLTDSYNLSYSNNDGKVDGVITGQNLSLQVASSNLAISFAGRKR